MHVCSAGPLAQGFTRREFIEALRELKCNVSERAIYYVFEEVFEHDNHPLFAKIDPGQRSSPWNRKFRPRSLEDIKGRLLHGIRYRVYERTFQKHRDTLIGFEVFTEALPGSDFAKTLESALKPLYREQKQRFESLKHSCEQKIAAYRADLENLHSTPLPPEWTIDKPCELPALLARGIYEADPEDRSKTVWARLLGMSKSSVGNILKRAGIERTAYTTRAEVDSVRDARDLARELGAKIRGVEVDGVYQQYDIAMDIPQGSAVILQPPSRHEIVSDEKQIIWKDPATGTKPAGTRSLSIGSWLKPAACCMDTK